MITLLYSGNLGIGQDISTILRAVDRLNCNGDLRLVIVGSGKELSSIRRLVSELQLGHTEFREPVALYYLNGLLVSGDVHLIFQKPGTEGLLVPSKIYGTLAAGRPSLFVGPSNCEVSRIIRESRSGFVVEAGDIEGALNALKVLIASAALRLEMGNNAREYYVRHFGRQRSVLKIIDIIERSAEPKIKGKGNPIFRQSLRVTKTSRTANDRPNSKSLFAAVAASLLVFALGLSFRALAGKFSAPIGGPPIQDTALERFPIDINGWIGQDVRLDDAVRSQIGAEAYLNRCYSHRDSLESVSLFVAASSMHRATLIGHPPELCNVGAGWRLVKRSSTELRLSEGANLPCSIFEFLQGGLLDGEKKVVLCYYIADGQYYGSRSLGSRIRRHRVSVEYVAQVQIVASSYLPAGNSTITMVYAFAVDSATEIARLFVNMNKDRDSDESVIAREG